MFYRHYPRAPCNLDLLPPRHPRLLPPPQPRETLTTASPPLPPDSILRPPVRRRWHALGRARKAQPRRPRRWTPPVPLYRLSHRTGAPVAEEYVEKWMEVVRFCVVGYVGGGGGGEDCGGGQGGCEHEEGDEVPHERSSYGCGGRDWVVGSVGRRGSFYVLRKV
jgi:hypothetical protein